MPCANNNNQKNKTQKKTAHPYSLISSFVVPCSDSIVSVGVICEMIRLLPAPVAEQTSSSLTLSYISKDRFSHDMAQIEEGLDGV